MINYLYPSSTSFLEGWPDKDGNVSQSHYEKVLDAARSYYRHALLHMKKFPFTALSGLMLQED